MDSIQDADRKDMRAGARKPRARHVLAAMAAALLVACAAVAAQTAVQASAAQTVVAVYNIGSPTETDVKATLYNDGSLVIDGTGDMISYSGGYTPWALDHRRDSITSVSFWGQLTPTNLDYYFHDCEKLASVHYLPSTVTSMCCTFDHCYSLTKAPELPASLTNMEATFYYCTSLVEVPDLPAGVENLDSTFSYCKSLVHPPAVPDGVTNMNSAFYSCDNLVEATLIPESVTDATDAFRKCENLRYLPAGFKFWHNTDTDQGIRSNYTIFRIDSKENTPKHTEWEAEQHALHIDAPADPSITKKEDYWIRVGRKVYVQTEVDIESKTTVHISGEETYNGSQIRPDVDVEGMTEGKDYVVSYGENRNAGTGTVTVSCIRNYKGSTSREFTISRKKVAISAGITAQDREYDKTTTATLDFSQVVFDGKVEGDDLGARASGSFADAEVGEGKRVNIYARSLTGEQAGNYEIASTGNQEYTTASISTAVLDFTTDMEADTKPKTYNGREICPKVSLRHAGAVLDQGVDYDVTYSDNVDVGKARIDIKAKNSNYKGVTTIYFNIVALQVKVGGIKANSKVYDGTKSAELRYDETSVYFTGKLPKDKLCISGTGTFDTADAGENKTVWISDLQLSGDSAKNYELAPDGQQTSARASIESAELDFSKAVVDEGAKKYNGTRYTPFALINKLTEGSDYTVSYGDNVNAGTDAGSITIEGLGNYTGSKTWTFDITAKTLDFSQADVDTDPKSYGYGGHIEPKALMPDPLKKDVDYKVSYSDNVNAGTGSITIEGLGNYTGSETWTFSIEPVGLNLDYAEADDDPKEYTGSPITPDAQVEFRDPATDYEVSWSNNVNVGTGTIILRGKGNFTGEKTWTFPITAKKIDFDKKAMVEPNMERVYTGGQIAPLVAVDGLEISKDYSVEYGENVNVGTASEAQADASKGGRITIKGKKNYAGERTYYFSIWPASIDERAVVEAIGSRTATGAAIEPSPVVKSPSGAVLERGVDYELSYKDNVNPGTATVTVAGLGNWAGKQEATFTIEAAPGPAPVAGVWKRLAGNTALSTMKAIVNEGWTESEYAIVATNKGYQDALSASGLAGLLGCPVLMTAPDALSTQTKALIESKKVRNVVIVGGTAAVSDAVKGQIEALGAKVERVAGNTAVGTANKVYDYGKTVNGGWGSDAIVATSGSYHDALSIAPYAYAKKAPIFLARAKDGTLGDATASRVKAKNFTRTLIAGGTAAVASSVDGQVTKPMRLAGNTAYGTCKKVAEFCLQNGMTASHMGVATGRSYHDALAGAALCGKMNSILVLADDKNSGNVDKVVKPNKAALRESCYIFGGASAVSAKVESALKAACE